MTSSEETKQSHNKNSNDESSRVKAGDFLHPNSMLTPGIAGATVMLITNTLFLNFNCEPKYTALSLSFLFGFIVLIESKHSFILKSIYYCINSLVIFTVAAGSSVAGSSLTAVNQSQTSALSFISPAEAQIAKPTDSSFSKALKGLYDPIFLCADDKLSDFQKKLCETPGSIGFIAVPQVKTTESELSAGISKIPDCAVEDAKDKCSYFALPESYFSLLEEIEDVLGKADGQATAAHAEPQKKQFFSNWFAQ